jgi:hypothetical protein
VLTAERRIIVLDNWNKDAPYQDDLCVGCDWEKLVRKSFCTRLIKIRPEDRERERENNGYERGRIVL